jgi:uncharacterized membrane protein
MQPTPSLNKATRIGSIDIVRGIAMIIMALDHVRDYFHADAFLFDPLDLDKTNPAIFFTRWITHYCAPVFVFLAGTSAFFVGQRKSKRDLSVFLLKRGLWLIVLEFTVLNFGWNFDIGFSNIFFIVIWALGISMIVLAGLIHLPFRLILFLGLLLVFGHNLMDGIGVTGNKPAAFGWALVHQQGFFEWQGKNILIGYPIIPWPGLMALGYCFGIFFTNAWDLQRRRKALLTMGGSAVLLFIIIRLINMYGDPSAWSVQQTTVKTILSFLKTTKYPPSLLYLLMTIGPTILLIALLEGAKGQWTRIVSIYGRVPLFYYVLHIYLIHVLVILCTILFTDFSWKIWIQEEPIWFATNLKGFGFSLGVVYLVWLGVVVGLYPLCKWYDRYKISHKEQWWLSYL